MLKAVVIDTGDIQDPNERANSFRSFRQSRRAAGVAPLHSIQYPSVLHREIRRVTRNVLLVNWFIITGVLVIALCVVTNLFTHSVQLDTIHLLVGLGIAGLIALFAFRNVVRAARFRHAPREHPALYRLAARGDVADQLASFESETAGGEPFGKMLLTANWLLAPRLFGFHLIPLVELVWATMMFKVSKLWGIIETDRKATSVELYDLDGWRYLLSVGSERQRQGLLHAIVMRVPWIFLGGEKLASFWEQDASLVIEAVEERHKQYQSDSGSVDAQDA